MRVAFLSIVETAQGAVAGRKAFLPLVGKSVVERQLDLMVELGCEKIICLAPGMSENVIPLQHAAEKKNVRFHIISTPHALLCLVRSTDEVIVCAEGIVTNAQYAREFLGENAAILVLPVEAGIEAGFQRIDLNHAWAGALVISGRLVDRLADLPPDCDALSALLRIALQARVPERQLPESVLTEGNWALLSSLEEARSLEARLVRRYAATSSRYAPGKAIPSSIIAALGIALLERGIGARTVFLSALTVGCVAAACGWWFSPTAGFWLLAFASIMVQGGAALMRVERGESGKSRREIPLKVFFPEWLFDALAAAMAARAISNTGGPWTEWLFPPLITFGLLYLVPRLTQGRWATLLVDRLLIFLLLGALAIGDIMFVGIQALSIVLLGGSLYFSRVKRG